MIFRQTGVSGRSCSTRAHVFERYVVESYMRKQLMDLGLIEARLSNRKVRLPSKAIYRQSRKIAVEGGHRVVHLSTWGHENRDLATSSQLSMAKCHDLGLHPAYAVPQQGQISSIQQAQTLSRLHSYEDVSAMFVSLAALLLLLPSSE